MRTMQEAMMNGGTRPGEVLSAGTNAYMEGGDEPWDRLPTSDDFTQYPMCSRAAEIERETDEVMKKLDLIDNMAFASKVWQIGNVFMTSNDEERFALIAFIGSTFTPAERKTA